MEGAIAVLVVCARSIAPEPPGEVWAVVSGFDKQVNLNVILVGDIECSSVASRGTI